jgi:hypothetical protein
MTTNKDQLARLVGMGAVTIGAAHVLVPTLSGRFWGLAPGESAVVPHVIRLYGISLVGLGVTSLSMPAERDGMMRVAAGVGSATSLACLLGGLRGRVGARGALTTSVAAAGLAALAASAVGKR